MKRKIIIICMILLMTFVISTNVLANVSSIVNVRFVDIGKCKVVDFDNSYTITLRYIWYSKIFNGETYEKLTGIMYVSSDEVKLEKTEISNEEFWDESYEDYSEQEMSFTLRRDMLKKESGVISFQIISYDSNGIPPDRLGVAGSMPACLYFAVDGNKLCLSEYEDVVDNYLARRKMLIGIAVAATIMVIFIICMQICKKYKKCKKLQKNLKVT